MNSRIVLIKDLVGTKPITVDQRTRNADGSLKYPDQQPEPHITTLEKVWQRKQAGEVWLYWQWARLPSMPYGHNYSGITIDLATDYALQVIEK